MRFIPLCCFLFLLPHWAQAQIDYQLDIQVVPAQKSLQGKIQLLSDTNTQLQLQLPPLEALSLNGVPQKLPQTQLDIELAAQVPVLLNYQVTLRTQGDNLVTRQHLFLLDNTWYPQPKSPVRYLFSALLPADFRANSEADSIMVSKQGAQRLFVFAFPHPLEHLTLTASNQFIHTSEEHNEVQIETYFFQKDKDLAKTYRDYTKTYLDMYTQRLGTYPFKRFAIVMHKRPTGWALPTYTLLGQRVARLPFIVKTSLGHELLHEWFGHQVWIDYESGNWAEGLVNYLADQHYAHLRGEGAQFRQQILLNYAAYVDDAHAMPVVDFRARHNKLESAVGYGKVAMIFHQLQQRLGEETFTLALREFLKNNAFRAASWTDIQTAFETISQEDLSAFFEQWLQRKDIPQISVEKPQVKVAQGQLKLLFKLKQYTESPYDVQVPLQIDTSLGTQTEMLHLNTAEKSYSIPLEALPSRIALDAQYDLMRALDEAETPPILAQILALNATSSECAEASDNTADAPASCASHAVKVILNQADAETYQPLFEALNLPRSAWEDEALSPQAALTQQPATHLVIAGQPLEALIGGVTPPEQGMLLKLFKHPYAADKRILWLYAEEPEQALMAARKINHYGKYSALHFINGKRQESALQNDSIAHSHAGIPIWQQEATAAIPPVQAQHLADILPQLALSKVIYIGEQHDQFAHHINQLTVIRYLQQKGHKVAIGLEMFQQPYQAALDDYLAGNTSESEFLKASQYFNKWRYDYNLYKPLIDFAKQHQLPLIALNIEGDISRQVGREGIPKLDNSAQAQLPQALDFAPYAYRQDLKSIFALHQSAQIPGMTHATKTPPQFEHFHQAQVLWDESMAEKAHQFWQKHPEHTLVILAGNGHIRYGYGIPERLKRRNGVDFVSVVQDEIPMPGIADYVLYPPPLDGEQAPKLGVFINDKEARLTVIEVEPHRPAALANVQKEDVILSLDGQPVNGLADLKSALMSIGLGNSAVLEVEREGKPVSLEVQF